MIVPLPGYGVNSAPPVGIENGTARWTGPETFEPSYLSITYKRGLRRTPTIKPVPGSQDAVGPLVAVGTFGVAAFGVLLFYLRSRGVRPLTNGAEREPGARADSPVDRTAGGERVVDRLLSDEERVERLLEANGGRMRQAAIVKETEWSNAKVSQLLSAMDEDGRIDKLRLGRENLIILLDEDVSDIETR